MPGCSGACRRIRRLIPAIGPAGQWGSPAGGHQCDREETNGCVYPLLLWGAVSLAYDAAGFRFGATRGSGGEHSQFFGANAESSDSVARTIPIAHLVSLPELDLLAEGLAVSGQTFARRNSGLNLRGFVAQVFRVMATEVPLGLQGSHCPPSMGEVSRLLDRPRAANRIPSGPHAPARADQWRVGRLEEASAHNVRSQGKPLARARRQLCWRKSCRKRPPTGPPRPISRCSAAPPPGTSSRSFLATGSRHPGWCRLVSPHRVIPCASFCSILNTRLE